MNAMVRAGVAGARALPALLGRARTLATNVFTTTPTAAAAAGKRLGMISAVPAKVLGAMKNNKFATALVLFELGSAGNDLLSEMAAEDAEIADMIARYGVTNDPIPDGGVVDMLSLKDEMQCITDAANAVGGMRRLHQLRRAIALPEEYFKYYDGLRDVSQAVR